MLPVCKEVVSGVHYQEKNQSFAWHQGSVTLAFQAHPALLDCLSKLLLGKLY